MRFVDPSGYCAAEGQIGYAENPMLIIVIENFAGGVGNSVWDTLKGIGTMIIHPIQTGRNLKEALSHPIVTITSIGSLIKTSFVEQVIQGDAESRSRYAGKAAGEILMFVVSAKGAEKLAKAIKGLDKAEDVAKVLDTLDEPFKVIDDVDDVSKYFDDVVNSADEVSREALNLSSQSVNDKLTRYLLNMEHPVGGNKAKWFKEALGYTQENMDDLAKQIIFDPNKAVQTGVTEYGTKFNQTISITGANGKIIDVTFAWMKSLDDDVVRLITAIPTKK